MEDGHDDQVTLYEQLKKDKRPFIEMEVTALVQADPPFLTWVMNISCKHV